MAQKEAIKTSEGKKGSPIMSILFSVASAAIMAGAAAGIVMITPPKPTVQCAASPSENDAEHIEEIVIRDYSDVVFVTLDPLLVSLGNNAQSEYLKISISLETNADYEKDVDHLRPKFRDILNSYLRAVDENDLVEPMAMMHLRAQLLRRLQLVASADAVKDVLITDFVLN